MRYERFYKINGNNNVNTLRVEIYYLLGGMNVWTYKNEPRGYYLSILPVMRDGNMESYEAFCGARQCILPVNRNSNRRYEEAKAQIPQLMDIVRGWCERKGYDVDFSDYTERERNV